VLPVKVMVDVNNAANAPLCSPLLSMNITPELCSNDKLVIVLPYLLLLSSTVMYFSKKNLVIMDRCWSFIERDGVVLLLKNYG